MSSAPLYTPESQTPVSRAEQARINGARSKGPKTEEGKAVSSQNARKHGLTAKHSLVDPDHASEYLQHRSSLMADLKPKDAVEEMLAEQVVKASWKLRQAHNIEIDLMTEGLELGESLHSAFTENELTMIRLSRYQTAIERSMYRALNELRKRQADADKRRKYETNPKAASGPSLEMIQAEIKRRGITGALNYETNPNVNERPLPLVPGCLCPEGAGDGANEPLPLVPGCLCPEKDFRARDEFESAKTRPSAEEAGDGGSETPAHFPGCRCPEGAGDGGSVPETR